MHHLLRKLEAALNDKESAKRLAGYKAVDEHVRDGMVIGLGTGSTAYYAVERVGQLIREGKLFNVYCIPTSERTGQQALSLNIPLITLDDLGRDKIPKTISVAIDGADAVDKDLNVIKGGGGALLREKMVEIVAEKFVCIVDESKLCDSLGPSFALPVEIVQFCHEHTIQTIAALPEVAGCMAVLRTGAVGNNRHEGETPAVTDNGNFIVDLFFSEPIKDIQAVAMALKNTIGVVEHGLFCNMVTTLIVAKDSGVCEERVPRKKISRSGCTMAVVSGEWDDRFDGANHLMFNLLIPQGNVSINDARSYLYGDRFGDIMEAVFSLEDMEGKITMEEANPDARAFEVLMVSDVDIRGLTDWRVTAAHYRYVC